MNEHIAYAMRNADATQAWIYFNKPNELLDWSHLAIELIFVLGFALSIVHAWRYYKSKDSLSALLTLFAAFFYGLVMDVLSYYTVENFWHGEFSIMLLFNKLPFYITCLYPALIYHAIMTIRRYEFSRIVEAISTGLFAGFLYMIFDNLGPMLGWWIWDTTDPTTFPYVSSVPLTSYAWMFLFTSAFTFINQSISWNWLSGGQSKLKIAFAHVFQPLATIFMGVLLFIPRNLFARNTPPWNMIPLDENPEMGAFVYLVMFSLAIWLFMIKWRKPEVQRDLLLMAFPFIYLNGLTYIIISKIHLFSSVNSDGLTNDGLAVGNLVVIIFALIISATILFLSHPTSKQNHLKSSKLA